MRLSALALFLLRSYAALAALALMLGWPHVAAMIGIAGFVNIGAIGWQLVDFGRLMHRIVETVAKQARLVPLEPVRHTLPQFGHPEPSDDPTGTSGRTSEAPLVRG